MPPSDTTALRVCAGLTHRLRELQGDPVGPAGGPPEAQGRPLQEPDVAPGPGPRQTAARGPGGAHS